LVLLPYTLDEEAKIIGIPRIRPVSHTLKVPTTFDSKVARGLFRDLGTEPRAARCTMHALFSAEDNRV
jgi:hypothetical protein